MPAGWSPAVVRTVPLLSSKPIPSLSHSWLPGQVLSPASEAPGQGLNRTGCALFGDGLGKPVQPVGQNWLGWDLGRGCVSSKALPLAGEHWGGHLGPRLPIGRPVLELALDPTAAQQGPKDRPQEGSVAVFQRQGSWTPTRMAARAPPCPQEQTRLFLSAISVLQRLPGSLKNQCPHQPTGSWGPGHLGQWALLLHRTPGKLKSHRSTTECATWV